MEIDEEKLQEHLGTAIRDFGATLHAPLVVIGDKLGLYRALAREGPLTSSELAAETDTAERYVREWLRSQAAGGYVTYDPSTDRYSLTPEQAALLADEDSPVFVGAHFQVALSAARVESRLTEAFRTGEGIGWGEQDATLFHGTARSFGPTYQANLVEHWIPALDGVEEKLKEGARVADVGCGLGRTTLVMARAYPESEFVGVDFHEPSIEAARENATEADVADRVAFEVAAAKDLEGGPFDFVTMFDCLHDMGDPVGAAARVRDVLEDDGTWMIVEPYANEAVEENFNPMGRAFYSISTLVCTPCALDQEAETVLGAQAGEERLGEVAREAGFTRFRRAAETPLNMILEARP